MAETMTPQLLPNNPGNHVFPLVYRLQGSGFWLCTLFGLVIVGAGLAAMRFALSHVSPVTVPEGPGALTLLIVCFPFVAMGAFFFVLAFFYRLILKESSIEENYVMWQKCFLLDEILGKKEYRPSGTVFVRTVAIFPKNRRLRPMKLEMHFKDTTALDAWLSLVPDIEPTPNDWPKLPRCVPWLMPAFFMLPVLIRLLLLAYNHIMH